MAKGKKQGKAGKGRYQSQKSGPKGPSGPDTRVESVHKKIPGGHLFPVPGLTNLGNTCFFNAVLQNISQSHYLRVRLEHLVSSPSYTTELKISGSGLSQELTVADQPGQLTKALNSFLSEMAQHPGRSLNPRQLFSEICRKASRFSSFQQQDSQELLRYLLDSMRSEEINRIKRAILASFSVGKKDHKKVTDKDREDIKAYGHEADLAPTFVDEVFGGVLVSTVLCKECNCHSMMRETFLDLSLPIPEDKSQPKTPPSYQARGRKNKKGAEGAGYKIGKGKLDEEKALPVAKEAAMSKHQQKKARKEKTKGAKKSKSNTKSLQDFLRDGSEAVATPSQKEEAKSEEVERDNTPGNTEITRAERANATAELVLGGNDNDARGSKNAGGNDDSTGKNDDDVGSRGNDDNARSRENDGNAGEIIADKDNAMEKEGRPGVGTCAATDESDPFQPSSEEQPVTGNIETLADELATIQVADDCHNDTTLAKESQQAVDLKENVVEGQSTPDIAQPGSVSQGAAASEEVAASKGTSNAANENIQLDSLQASLKKFCAPELLTGKNRFACIFCTKKKMEETNKQPISSQGRDTTGTAENDMEVGTNEEEERNLSQRAEKESSLEAQHSLLAPPDSDGEAEDVTGPKYAGCKDVEQALKLPDNRLGEDAKDGENAGSEVSSSADEGGNREQPNEENSHEESTKESDDDDGEGAPKTKAAAGKGTEKVVFSEATKQLLIERPPLVLNLHMKRFLQSGRHLRKNNKHISFPTVLDMRPFCTPKCQPLCDSKGKLLYSLYGVVEHSGGMHGGHYTAYVRVRKPPTTSGCDPTTATSTTSKGSPSKTALTTSECDLNKTTPQTVQCDLPPHASNAGASIANVGTQASTLSEPPPHASNAGASIADVGTQASTLSEPPPHASYAGASIADTSTQASTPNCATRCCSRTVEVAAPEGENDRNFDLSSTMGNWYYISDGHVRTATESEVLKGQAYLLFYERLPFQHAD